MCECLASQESLDRERQVWEAEYARLTNELMRAYEGAGVDHDALVSLAKKSFGGLPASAAAAPSADTYTGGESRIAADEPSTHREPAVQLRHSTFPLSGVNLPAGHNSQVALPGAPLYVPAKQAV